MRTRRFLQAVTGFCVCGLLAAPALAASHVADMKFMKNAAMDGMFEVQMGHIAARQGASRGVRQFGMHMVRDHSQANHSLKMIAMQEHVMLPKSIGPKNQAVEDRVSRLRGMAFDRAYVQAMIAGHVKDLAAFRKEAMRGKNPPVRTFANQYETVIQGHLMLARNLHTHSGRMGA